MDYQRIYDAFIADRLTKFDKNHWVRHRKRERHHILPKCMGGTDDRENFISLTPSDHLFAHLLLAKIHGGKLAVAFIRMRGIERYRGRHSRQRHEDLTFQALEVTSKTRLGTKHSAKQAAGIARWNATRKGKPVTPEQLAGLAKTWERTRGRPADPKTLVGIKRKGKDRSAAQQAHDLEGSAYARSCITAESYAKVSATKKGVPWSDARRAAQELVKARREAAKKS